MKYVKTYKESLLESDQWIDTEVRADKWLNRWYARHPDQTPSNRTTKIKIDNTKTYQVLKFLYEKGAAGASYTDIVKFIVEDLGKEKYNWKTHRGYWGTNLLSNSKGILTKYATKNRSGKWVLDNIAIEKHFDELLTDGDPTNSYFYKKTGMMRDEFESIADILGIDKNF